MKKLIIALFLVALLAGCSVKIQNKKAPEMRPGTVEEQQSVATVSAAFLNKLDTGKINDSWEMTSPLLRQTTDQKNWSKILHQMRNYAGIVNSRKVKAIAFMKTIDNSPVGQYAMLGTETAFQNLKATERVVMHNDQGTWKVMGYFIENTYQLKLKP